MKVRLRATDLASDMAVKTDKMIVCFNWLYEFKFSSFQVLAGLLKAELNYARRFLSLLVEQGYLVTFTNVNAPANFRLIALTQVGVNFLIANSMADGEAKARDFSRFKKTVMIFHHLGLQEYILQNISQYSEVIWEAGMVMSTEELRPDAIVHHKSLNAKIAIEHERTRKIDARIQHNFYKHYENIKKGYYAGVIYLFEDESDRDKYKEVFHRPEWERFKIGSNSAKPVPMMATFKPSSVAGLNTSFKFILKNNKAIIS